MQLNHHSLPLVWSCILLAGCATDCGTSQPPMSTGVYDSGEYRADEVRASIQRVRRGSPDAPYLVSLDGCVRRTSEEAPMAALSSRLRVMELLDADGNAVDILPVGEPRASGLGADDSYFHFQARPALTLQGRGTFGPLTQDVFDAKRVRGIAEVWEMSELTCVPLDLRGRALPTGFLEIAPGAWVAMRAFEQAGRRIDLHLMSYVSNAPEGPIAPCLDPRRGGLEEFLVVRESEIDGYDPSRAPIILGYELLDERGCVLGRRGELGGGLNADEGYYGEENLVIELEVDRPVVALNVVVATVTRVVDVPFECELRIWLRDDDGRISNDDPRLR